jgi:hypothetical protein
VVAEPELPSTICIRIIVFRITMGQSILTPSGEQFLADILHDRRNGDEDYFNLDLCEDWGLEYTEGVNIKIPDAYEGYGQITASESPLLLKTQFGVSAEIRKTSRDKYPYFHNELFGEVCIWEEALRRGEPHTDLFAPVFQYDTSNYEWAVVGRATDIHHRGASTTKCVEENGRELGWEPDDTETGVFENRRVAVDYGFWWRRNDEWITEVNELEYISTDSIYNNVSEPVPANAATFNQETTREPHSGTAPSTDHQTHQLDSRRVRFQRWLSSLFS